MESKDEIRKRVLNLRNSMSQEDIRTKSAAIFERVCALRQYKEAKIILVYMDFKNEVMTGRFIRKCLDEGKRVALPKVTVEDEARGPAASSGPSSSGQTSPGSASSGIRNLAVYLVNDVDQDTCPGYRGIIEPDSTLLKCLNPVEIDLAVIPGVAFDYWKNRIGYGAGYYDRFLHKLRADCLKIGAAFCLQLVDKIPAGQYDLPVDRVVTEDMIL